MFIPPYLLTISSFICAKTSLRRITKGSSSIIIMSISSGLTVELTPHTLRMNARTSARKRIKGSIGPLNRTISASTSGTV